MESLSAFADADELYASLDTKIREDCVTGKGSKTGNEILQEKQRKSARSARLGKRLDPEPE